MAAKKEHRIEIRNKKASFDYEFLETYEAGIVLVGTEIKSIRMGKVSLVDSFCYFVGNELFVKGMNVAKYFWGSWGQHEPLRDRKLLLTKKELKHLHQTVKEKGLTIVWRDYPKTPEWQSLPRGTYGSSDSGVSGEFVRDDLFSGTGTLRVVSDDRIDPSVMILR